LSICIGGGTGEGFHRGGELSDEPSIISSVFASWPMTSAKRRILSGDTTMTGRPAASGTDEGLLEAAGGVDDDALDAITG
jgi:hypothetical protein